eukprot:1587834-Rhodomonas_salina.1
MRHVTSSSSRAPSRPLTLAALAACSGLLGAVLCLLAGRARAGLVAVERLEHRLARALAPVHEQRECRRWRERARESAQDI